MPLTERRTAKMGGKEFKYTGGYVVIHHGPKGEHNTPLFLVDPFRGDNHPHTFTANIGRAQFYDTYMDAKKDAVAENVRLAAEKHPLAGRIEVGEIFIRDYEPKED